MSHFTWREALCGAAANWLRLESTADERDSNSKREREREGGETERGRAKKERNCINDNFAVTRTVPMWSIGNINDVHTYKRCIYIIYIYDIYTHMFMYIFSFIHIYISLQYTLIQTVLATKIHFFFNFSSQKWAWSNYEIKFTY